MNAKRIKVRRDYLTRRVRSNRTFPAVPAERVRVLRYDQTMPEWVHVRAYADGARFLMHASNLEAVPS